MTFNWSPAGITRTREFWAAYALVAFVALLLTWRLFPIAIPLVNLDVKLDRGEALARAQSIDAKLGLSVQDPRTAVRFSNDQALQNYIELQGGGKAAFRELLSSRAYSPYWWEVRLFKPGVVNEATVRFRPDGSLYGFVRQLPETFLPSDRSRAALDTEVARELAETRAREDWGVDFAPYTLLERNQSRQPNGRVDHTFIYRDASADIAEAHFRLRLEVLGDELTAVDRQAQIPETFYRRYVELRSANNTIASAATIAAVLLYGVGGCVLGVLWLLRRHWLMWRPALVAGLVVGALLAASMLSKMPSEWFSFDTAQSVEAFWAGQLGGAALALLGGTLAYGLAFMAAESLSRRAFGEHPQLWRAWTRAAAPTWQVLGRTLGGYLFVPIELAFVSTFYFTTNRWLGWWQPSEALTDPNILGSALPALAPVALSLQAGFMEECVFRAVPLSLAALIGGRFGQRRLAIGIALVVQALVFAAAHANYPGFPSYSRLVELFVPALVWGLIFLRFGLLPTIMLHVTFDLVLFSIPLFLVDAPGTNLQRALAIGAALVPLVIVASRRIEAGKFGELPRELTNAGWQSAAPAPAVEAHPHGVEALAAEWVVTMQRYLPVLAVVGLAAWLAFTPFRADVPPLPQARKLAEAQADAVLKSRGVELGPEWRRTSVPKLAVDDSLQSSWHQFVWREAGRATYESLIGRTLAPPLWEVRYARFEGPVADRVEEWRVTVTGDGTARGIRHTLPEERPGAKPDRDTALGLAEAEIKRRFGQDSHALQLVGAEENQRDARADWTFVFADPRIDVGRNGQARLMVSVAGDEVSSAGRFVHVPETWLRAERERNGKLDLVKYAVGALFAIAAIAGLIAAVLQWTRHQYDPRAMWLVTVAGFAISAASLANHWPVLENRFSTAEPVASQAAIAIAGSLVFGLLGALLSGLAAGGGAWAAERQRVTARSDAVPAWAVGVGALVMTAGIEALVESLAPMSGPRWPSYELEANAMPALAAILRGARVLTTSGIALFVLHWLVRITTNFTQRRLVAVLVLVLAYCGVALAGGSDATHALLSGGVRGLLAAIVVYALLRFDLRTVPAYIAADVVLSAVEEAAQKGTMTAAIACVLTTVSAAACAWLVLRYIERTRAAASAASARALPA